MGYYKISFLGFILNAVLNRYDPHKQKLFGVLYNF